MQKNEVVNQAKLFTYYLCGQPASPAVEELYVNAIEHSQAMAPEDRLSDFITRHAWTLPSIDAYLAIAKPASEVRRRIYLMLAILETSPDYYQYFLPRKQSRMYIVKVGFIGLRAALRLVLGAALVKTMRLGV